VAAVLSPGIAICPEGPATVFAGMLIHRLPGNEIRMVVPPGVSAGIAAEAFVSFQ